MTDLPDLTDRPQHTAIVLGGGGVAGIAWELGLLSGLLEAGIPLADADLVVGTSAGSVVGTLLRTGGVADAYGQQVDDVPWDYEEPASPDWAAIGAQFVAALQGATGDQDARARIGRLARTVTSGQSQEERIASFRATFPADTWPDAPLGITTVDATDGSFRVLTAADGVPLTRAIAASCSVPLVWSPVTVDGRPYVDGGARSGTNADAAAGYERVLVIACRAEDPSPTGPWLDRAVAGLRHDGSAVEVVVADATSQAAYGTNVLALSTRAPAAHAGRAQAAAVAARVRDLWVG
ncbi:patatin-like phospholipase family protein [Curtobacterium sp. MCBD17_028]|uniref:patatin-like phospholipase family protein n=1 Tax=Curtobacterium sp. MCBD17_028 TaxID=2175670 RepID=UPI0021AD1AD0|nr:patatin-like phospholipase family protein [Curtobacterium sp. MCBD17_028]